MTERAKDRDVDDALSSQTPASCANTCLTVRRRWDNQLFTAGRLITAQQTKGAQMRHVSGKPSMTPEHSTLQ